MSEVRVADEVWLATAMLHYKNPQQDDFSTTEIVDRAYHEGLQRPLRPGVQIHVSQHCVANKRPNPGNYRMLYETTRGRRRLFRHTDETHPYRSGKVVPDPQDIPESYHYLLTWYRERYDGGTAVEPTLTTGLGRKPDGLLKKLIGAAEAAKVDGDATADNPSREGKDLDQIWGRVRELEGRTLRTTGQGKSFDVEAVTEHSVAISPHSTHRLRSISRQEFERAVRLGLRGEKLTPIAIRQARASEANPAYVAAILRTIGL